MSAVVYSREKCGYCDRAKELLADHSIPFEVRDVITDLDARRDYLALTDPPPTKVPQIVLDGKLIGGYDELRKLIVG